MPLILVFAGAATARAATPTIANQSTTGTVGVALTPYQVVATDMTGNSNKPFSWATTVSCPGITFDTTTGIFSGTPTAAGTYTGTVTATNKFGSATANMTITIVGPNLVGFRLPDFTVTTGSGANVLTLQMGANGGTTVANRFNATLEVQVPGTTTWVPYNRFVGINDNNSWTTDAPLPVRNSNATGAPQAFSSAQLTQPGVPPAMYMKADPRSTRFGIFQINTNPTTSSRIVLSLWPSANGTVPNGFGGTVGTDVEHVPNRFNVSPNTYYPATFAINAAADARDTATTMYADNDGVTRPADAYYPDVVAGTGTSTPYGTDAKSPLYRPIFLNRPFRNVGELGYVFRDLPWKTLDLFSQNSADAGLLDVFCINDGPQSTASYDGTNFGTVVPQIVAGPVNLNSQQPAGLQAILASTLWDDTSSLVSSTGSPTAQNAQTMANNILAGPNGTSVTPMQNRAELITRANLATQILPASPAQDNQTVKARREAVPRAISSVSQTRVWNLLIDVVAQSGHYKPNATSFPNDFMVEGQQHYWVHLAIDRLTGQVIDKQIEVVNE